MYIYRDINIKKYSCVDGVCKVGMELVVFGCWFLFITIGK